MVVYTVITSGYDSLKPIAIKNPSWEYVAIVDDLSIPANGWDLIHIDSLCPPDVSNKHYLQRWAKIIGGIEYFKSPTIYLDGSHEIIDDVGKLYSGKICLKKHPIRNCYVEEGEACKRLNKANLDMIDMQISAYLKMGLPRKSGMFETGILIRPYNNKVLDFCRIWWQEIAQYTHRDQLSIMKAIIDTSLEYSVMPPSIFSSFIKLHPHG